MRRGRALRVPVHGDAHPAGGLDGRPGPPDRDLLRAARATLAGLAATLVGVGLARFAYTPLLPALIGAGWFPPAGAAYLGAANLAGYLAGALVARRLAGRTGAVPTLRASMPTLRASMAFATAAFFACATPWSFAWYFVWRLGAGIAGGVLMVLAAPTVLPHVLARRRGLAGGVIFTGVGLGIAASGTIVPALLHEGLVATWCGLGAIAAVLTLVSWNGWPRTTVPAAPPTSLARGASPSNRSLRALYASYALNAFGLVPHMVFLVDFVARGLGRGLAAGGRYWVLFGIGAMLGPILAGTLADQVGFGRAIRLAFLLQALAIGVLVVSVASGWLVVSSLVVGAFVPGMVPLTLGRVYELVTGDALARTTAWSRATASFALGQAVAGYGLSFVYACTGDYALLFTLGAGALALALLIDLAGSRPARA